MVLDVLALLFHHKVSVSQLESTLHGKIMQVICRPKGKSIYAANTHFQEVFFFSDFELMLIIQGKMYNLHSSKSLKVHMLKKREIMY